MYILLKNIALTIAIMSAKGGTGKSTTSANLAGELNRSGQKTLFVDIDENNFFPEPFKNYHESLLQSFSGSQISFVNSTLKSFSNKFVYNLNGIDIFRSTGDSDEIKEIKANYTNFINTQKNLYDFILLNFPGEKILSLFNQHVDLIDEILFIATQDPNVPKLIIKSINDINNPKKTYSNKKFNKFFITFNKIGQEKAGEQFDRETGERFVNKFLLRPYMDSGLKLLGIESSKEWSNIDQRIAYIKSYSETPSALVPLSHIADNHLITKIGKPELFINHNTEEDLSLSREAIKRLATFFKAYKDK